MVGSPALPKAGLNLFKSKKATNPGDEKMEVKKKLLEPVKPAESSKPVPPPPPNTTGPMAQLGVPENGSASKNGILNRLTGKPALDVSPLTGRHIDRTVGVDKIKQQYEGGAKKNANEPSNVPNPPPIPQLPPKPQDKQESKGGETADMPVVPKPPVDKKGGALPNGNKPRANSSRDEDAALSQRGDEGRIKKQGSIVSPNQTGAQDGNKKIRSMSFQGKEGEAPPSPELSRRGDRLPVPAGKAQGATEVKDTDPKPLLPTGKQDEKEIPPVLDLKIKTAPVRTEPFASSSPHSPKSTRRFNQQSEAGAVESGSNNAPLNKPSTKPVALKQNAFQSGDRATSDKPLPGKVGGRPQLPPPTDEPQLPPRPGKDEPTSLSTKTEPLLPAKPGKDEPPLPAKPGKAEPSLPAKPKNEPALSTKPVKDEPPLPLKPGKDETPLPAKPGKIEPPLPAKPKNEPPLPVKPVKDEPPLPARPKNEPPLPGRGKNEPPLPARPAKDDPALVPPPASDENMKPHSAMSLRQSSRDDSKGSPNVGRSIKGDKSQPEAPPAKEGIMPRQRRELNSFKLPSSEEPPPKDEPPAPIREEPLSPLRSTRGGPSLPPKQSSKDDTPKSSKDQPLSVPPIKEEAPMPSRPTKTGQALSKQPSKGEPPLPAKMEPSPMSASTRDEPPLPARPSKGGQTVPKPEPQPPKLPANEEPSLPTRPSKGVPPQPTSVKEDPSCK